jgi:hypothetical protein
MKRSSALAVFALLVLSALPAAAADPVIHAGIDPWVTIPEETRVDFKNNPLPAGFFCKSSPAFTGRIWLRGVPLASDNPQFAKYDTIVERLDDAVFNSRGVARTRFQVKALQLEGISTFKNRCGEYYVQVTLDGEQPVTMMRIIRENNDGGRFVLTVRINTKVIFTRVDDPGARIEFAYPVTFTPSPYHRWVYSDAFPSAKRVHRATIDTDWDSLPDTLVPGTSNFVPGQGDGVTRFQNKATHDVCHGVQAN